MAKTAYDRLVGIALGIVLSLCLACEGRILYVDGTAAGTNDGSSWANAYRYLQDALSAASAAEKPVEIRVARGIYMPDQGAGITPGDQGATFQLLNGVTLTGGYAGSGAPDPNARDTGLYETILSGDLKGNDISPYSITTTKDNCCRVVMAASADETAGIDGFTITGGAGWGPCPDEYGGQVGVMIEAGSPVIRRCHFIMNRSVGLSVLAASKAVLIGCDFDDEGMLCVDSSPVLTDCTFSGGRMTNDGGKPSLTNCTFDAGGIFSHSRGHLTLADCVFRGSRERKVVEIWDGTSILTGCLFERNGTAGAPSYVIESNGGIVTLEDCRFVENDATSIHGPDLNLTRCSFVANKASGTGAISASGSLILCDCEFIGNSSRVGNGAISVVGDQLKATGCVFAGNSTQLWSSLGAIHSLVLLARLSNCTFVGNRGTPSAIECWGAPAELSHCIVWNGPDPFSRYPEDQANIKAAYSDIQGGYPGEGNIDVDPCFVDPGHWGDPNDPNVALGPDNPKAVWVNGDYHLRSQAGHWDRSSGTWVRDEVTSACIDAGDPNAPIGSEPFPNGGIVNLGAYGSTSEASKSYFGEPVCETQIAGDINGDCKVDQTDMDILLLHWLTDAADLINTPPTVTLTLVEDGEVYDYPTWVLIGADAADSDGSVVRVKFFKQYSRNGNERTAASTDSDPSDGWRHDWQWWGNTGVPFEGSCVIWAEAMDDDGATAVSPRITVTLRVTN
jgi:hypothetical protein